jgi:hypothetical protein
MAKDRLEQSLNDLVQDAVVWASQHGLVRYQPPWWMKCFVVMVWKFCTHLSWKKRIL